MDEDKPNLDLGAFRVGKPRTDYHPQTLEILEHRPEFRIDPWDFLDNDVKLVLAGDWFSRNRLRDLATNQRVGFLWSDVRWLYVPDGDGERCISALDRDRFEYRLRRAWAAEDGRQVPDGDVPGYIDCSFTDLFSALMRVPRFVATWFDAEEKGRTSGLVMLACAASWESKRTVDRYSQGP